MLTFNFTPFPKHFTERLVLREICADDVHEVLALRSNAEAMKYIDRPRATTAEEAMLYIQKNIDSVQNNEGISWAICLKDTAPLIGTIGFWRIDKANHRAEIGYMLHPGYFRKGYMQEAITAILDYGFKNMRLHSVEANINPANDASRKILEKNGFVQEAYFKENYYYDGKFLDSAIFSLLTPFK